MLPMKALRLSLGTLLAADATSLAPSSTPNEMALVTVPFALSELLSIGDITLASGDGLDAIVGVAGAQQVGTDPVTQEQLITIKAPAGGYRWALTSAPSLPVTIYGIALTTTAAGALLGLTLLDTPITVTNIGDEIDVTPVQMRMVARPLT